MKLLVIGPWEKFDQAHKMISLLMRLGLHSKTRACRTIPISDGWLEPKTQVLGESPIDERARAGAG